MFNFLVAVKSDPNNPIAWETAEDLMMEFESSSTADTTKEPEEPHELSRSEIHRLSKASRQGYGLKALAAAGKIKLVKRDRENEGVD